MMECFGTLRELKNEMCAHEQLVLRLEKTKL